MCIFSFLLILINYHKCSDFKQHTFLSYSARGQKSKLALMGLKMKVSEEPSSSGACPQKGFFPFLIWNLVCVCA